MLDLITYGLGNKYLPEKFQPIKNEMWVKPTGGLWASPIDSVYGWREWCRDENYGNLETSFRFQFTGGIYVINNLDDLLVLPSRFVFDDHFQFVDFEKCLASGIDAIHLTVNGQVATRFSRPMNLYGWDCESVLIMNPSGIVEVSNVCI